MKAFSVNIILSSSSAIVEVTGGISTFSGGACWVSGDTPSFSGGASYFTGDTPAFCGATYYFTGDTKKAVISLMKEITAFSMWHAF
ncbi:hypothetical protein ACIQ57_01125 [Lysinibacillus xylanilyticus]|uniref:hypothetical protein n=1 Tax=Lysinibacillus xylanilyticus TaxID=582475 RepID=UPI003801767F